MSSALRRSSRLIVDGDRPITDTEKHFVSEASVYRILRAHGLITSPAFVVIKAADEFTDKTSAAISERHIKSIPGTAVAGTHCGARRIRRAGRVQNSQDAWPSRSRVIEPPSHALAGSPADTFATGSRCGRDHDHSRTVAACSPCRNRQDAGHRIPGRYRRGCNRPRPAA